MPSDLAEQIVALLPRLRRYARVLVHDADLADDLVQSACERALAAERGPGEAPLDAWMFRILRNLWIDRVRAAAGAGEHVELDSIAELAQPTASGDAERQVLLRQVDRALQRLPEPQREVLLLACAEEMSYRQIADLLGVPIGTVMSRLARARANLSAVLGIDTGAVRLLGQRQESPS